MCHPTGRRRARFRPAIEPTGSSHISLERRLCTCNHRVGNQGGFQNRKFRLCISMAFFSFLSLLASDGVRHLKIKNTSHEHLRSPLRLPRPIFALGVCVTSATMPVYGELGSPWQVGQISSLTARLLPGATRQSPTCMTYQST